MDDIIKKMLDDLYSIDNSLRQHEKKLINIISELIKSRPDTQYNENFVQELRLQVLSRAKALNDIPEKNSQIKFMVNKNLYFALGGAVLTAFLLIPVMNLYYSKSFMAQDAGQDTLELNFKQKIAKLSDKAFGSFSESIDSNNLSNGRGSAVMNESASLAAPNAAISTDGLRQPVAAKEESAAATPGYGGGGGMNGEMMIVPPSTKYKFVYVGDSLPDIGNELPVYRRTLDTSMGNSLGNDLSKYNSGLLDFGKFANFKLTNFTINEDRDFGYSVYFNTKEGIVSISSNWERWPQPYAECRSTNCYEQLRLKKSDIPSDEKIIAIADTFLAAYKINLDNYGRGHIINSPQLERAVSIKGGPAAEYYIPDSIQVIYPLKINNQEVYDQGGSPAGISVEVNIRYNKVAGLYNLQTQNFEQSNYKTVKDQDRIIELVEQGGFNQKYYYGSDMGREEPELGVIKIGTPTIGLMRYWKNNPDKNRTEELFIPAYIFSVIDKPKGVYYYQDNIVIPIIKDFLDERSQLPPDGIPEPMPLLDSDVVPDKAMDTETVEAMTPADNKNINDDN